MDKPTASNLNRPAPGWLVARVLWRQILWFKFYRELVIPATDRALITAKYGPPNGPMPTFRQAVEDDLE